MFYLNWGPYWWFGVIQMKEHSRYFWDLISSILYVIWDTDLFYTVTFGGLGCDWLVLCFDWSSHKWFSCVFTCFYIYTLSSIATGCDNDFLGNWHMHTHTVYQVTHSVDYGGAFVFDSWDVSVHHCRKTKFLWEKTKGRYTTASWELEMYFPVQKMQLQWKGNTIF